MYVDKYPEDVLKRFWVNAVASTRIFDWKLVSHIHFRESLTCTKAFVWFALDFFLRMGWEKGYI